jgi:hypothetical protein
MPAPVTTDLVWRELEKQVFAVVGMVTARNEARTAGIVYTVRDRTLYFSSESKAWKIRHIKHNESVSVTVTIPKRIPFVPWVKIPAATITFSGTARVLAEAEVADEVVRVLLHGLEGAEELRAACSFVEIKPKGDFLTYGVGVSLKTMMKPEEAAGRVAVT